MNFSSIKSAASNLATVLISTVLCLLLLEGVLRLTEKPFSPVFQQINFSSETPETQAPFVIETPAGLRLKPNVKTRIEDNRLSHIPVDMEINSMGFRGPELKVKEKNEIRVMVLGDSITLADYLPFKLTYPSMLGEYFKANPSPILKGKPIEFINAGVGAIDLQTEYSILMEKGPQVRPDVVLIGMYLNDATHSFFLNVNDAPWFVRKSALLRMIYTMVKTIEIAWVKAPQRLSGDVEKTAHEKFDKGHQVRRNIPLEYMNEWPHNQDAFNHLISFRFWDWGYAWGDACWLELRQTLLSMKKTARENGFELAVALFPVSYQVQASYIRNEPQQQFAKLMGELGIPHVDLLPSLRDKFTKDKKNVFFDHCHLTPEGYISVTMTLAAFLERDVFPGLRGTVERYR